MKCPICKLDNELPLEEQPQPGTHAYTIVFQCGTEIDFPISETNLDNDGSPSKRCDDLKEKISVEDLAEKSMSDIITIGKDIAGSLFVFKASSYQDGYNQSSFDFLKEEFENFGNWDDVFGSIDDLGIGEMKRYKFKIVVSWDYEHVECDFEIKLEEFKSFF